MSPQQGARDHREGILRLRGTTAAIAHVRGALGAAAKLPGMPWGSLLGRALMIQGGTAESP